MEIEFSSEDLDRLEIDPKYTGGFPVEVVKAYRKRIQTIRAATDERDLFVVRGNRFEKLKGAREHQHSLRLNDQWRLIVQIKPSSPKNIIIVDAVEDYH